MADASVSASGRQLDVGSEQSLVLTSILPLPARETLVLKDADGRIARTLVDAQRSPGTYRDSWDGAGDDGKRLRDGQYRWVATFEDGEHARTIDWSAEKDGDAEVKSHPEYPKWDPFDSVPLKFTHSFDRPGEIVLVFSRETYYVHLTCEAPKFFCRFLDGFRPAGEFTYEWAGVDDTGTYRDDMRGIFVISHHEELSRNGVVVHGGRPAVTTVRVQPALYRPGLGSQNMTFALRTYRGERVSAVVTFTNVESHSVLRTIRVGDAAPGTVTVAWDGRGENGSLVAPGSYLIAVVATDSLGQSSRGEILARVEY
ncbi:MAG: hypothetical protein HY900_02660 [Deltaproteobacteria bacterium]|nr:hypothetical protein [Deltaproteobacteria bacterium]